MSKESVAGHVVENEHIKILWDVKIQTDKKLEHTRYISG